MTALLIPLLEALALAGLNLYTKMANTKPGSTDWTQLIPLIGQISTAISATNSILAQAQTENWTDQDPRWKPIFGAMHDALTAIEAQMV